MLCTQTDRGGTESRFEDQRPVLPGNRPNSAVRAIIVLSAGGGDHHRAERGVRGQPDGKQQQEEQCARLKGEDVTTEGHVNTRGSKYRELEPTSVVFFRASEFLFASKLQNTSL